MKNDILALMMRQKDMLFKNSVDPDGAPWKPLAVSTMKARNRKITDKKKKDQVSILVDTGTMKNSITEAAAPYGIKETTGDEVVLGTNVVYAAAQNFGATIVAGERSSLIRSDLKTKQAKILSATKFTIPPRPFIGIGDADEPQIVELIDAFVTQTGGFLE